MGLEDPVTEANVRKDLGEIALARDDLVGAQASFEAAEALAAPAGARAIVAHCRLGQARVAQRRGRGGRAAQLAEDAADLFERLGDLDRAYEARSVSTLTGHLRARDEPRNAGETRASLTEGTQGPRFNVESRHGCDNAARFGRCHLISGFSPIWIRCAYQNSVPK